ncbi:MAG TPA: radical SAM protein [bacterium]|nr:radical SAM protein [bacterium]
MRIALIAPAWGRLYGSFRALSREINTTAPLGLAYLAGALAAAGYRPKIYDVEVSHRDEPTLLAAVAEFAPAAIGVSATSPVIVEATRLARTIGRRMSKPLILGGPHISAVGADALRDDSPFAYGLLGDAEQTFPALLQALSDGADVSHIPGAVVRRDGQAIVNETHQPPADLDALPQPSFPGIEWRRYRWSVPGAGLRIAVPIIASRGCPYHCQFCFRDQRRRGVQRRQAANIVEEMRQRLAETPARHFVFVDDFLTGDREIINELCDRCRALTPAFSWEGDTRADAVNDELLRAMRRAGCVRLNFGVESGDPEILRRLGKQTDLRVVREAFAAAKRAGLETRGTFILGTAHETRATVRRTLRLAAGLRELDQPYISIAIPYPGTRLRTMAVAGEGGLRLLDASYERLGRYGNALMEINDLTPRFLIRAQKWGTLWAYLQPARLGHNLTRSGWREALRLTWAFLQTIVRPPRLSPPLTAGKLGAYQSK